MRPARTGPVSPSRRAFPGPRRAAGVRVRPALHPERAAGGQGKLDGLGTRVLCELVGRPSPCFDVVQHAGGAPLRLRGAPPRARTTFSTVIWDSPRAGVPTRLLTRRHHGAGAEPRQLG